jgi:hypothetical protein
VLETNSQLKNYFAMKAVVLYKTCRPEELTISEIPVPETKPGWVLIRVKAFGLNRSELMMREYEGDASYTVAQSAWNRMCRRNSGPVRQQI